MGVFYDEQIARSMLPDLEKRVHDLYTKPVSSKIWFEESSDSVSITISDRKTMNALVRFSLTAFPSCPAILISHEMYINESLRNLGIASHVQGFKKELARKYGCTSMQATTVVDNEIQNHILQKYGWKVIYKLENKHTGNDVLQWAINL